MGTSVSLGSSQAQGRGSAPLRTPDWLAVAYPPFGQTISYAKCNGNHDQSAYSIPSMREHSDSIKYQFKAQNMNSRKINTSYELFCGKLKMVLTFLSFQWILLFFNYIT